MKIYTERVRKLINPFFYTQKWPEFSFLDQWPSTAEIDCEIGFWDGTFLLDQAKKNPQKNYLGIEIRHQSLSTTTQYAANYKNIALVHGHAATLFEKWVPASVFSNIYIFFPDPWGKGRHLKRRLINQPFFELCVKVLKPQGKIWIQTDDLDYAEAIHKLLGQVFPKSFVTYSQDPWEHYPTFWKKKKILEGKQIHSFQVELRSN